MNTSPIKRTRKQVVKQIKKVRKPGEKVQKKSAKKPKQKPLKKPGLRWTKRDAEAAARIPLEEIDYYDVVKAAGPIPKTYPTPMGLRDACLEYIEWAKKKPLYVTRMFSVGGAIQSGLEPRLRALTKSGLCVFIGLTRTQWEEYKRRREYTHICTMVELAIYDQKFTGAAAGLLNNNIIARDLGLVDQQEWKGTVLPDTGTVTEDMDAKEAAIAYKQLISGKRVGA